MCGSPCARLRKPPAGAQKPGRRDTAGKRLLCGQGVQRTGGHTLSVSLKHVVNQTILYNLRDPNLTKCKRPLKKKANKHTDASLQVRRRGNTDVTQGGHQQSGLSYFLTISSDV